MTNTNERPRQATTCLWCGGQRAERAGVYICPDGCDGPALEQQEVAE